MMQSPELNLTEMLCWDLKRAVLGKKKSQQTLMNWRNFVKKSQPRFLYNHVRD